MTICNSPRERRDSDVVPVMAVRSYRSGSGCLCRASGSIVGITSEYDECPMVINAIQSMSPRGTVEPHSEPPGMAPGASADARPTPGCSRRPGCCTSPFRRAVEWRPCASLPARATTPRPGPQSEDPSSFAGRTGLGAGAPRLNRCTMNMSLGTPVADSPPPVGAPPSDRGPHGRKSRTRPHL